MRKFIIYAFIIVSIVCSLNIIHSKNVFAQAISPSSIRGSSGNGAGPESNVGGASGNLEGSEPGSGSLDGTASGSGQLTGSASGKGGSNANSANNASGTQDSTVQGGSASLGSSQPVDTSVGVSVSQSFDTVLGTFYNPLEFDRPEELVVRLINAMLLLVGIISVIMIILGGLRMVASGGSESQIKKGRETVTWAIGGLLVSLMAFSIVALIQSIIS
jgi:hypothetical protein